MSQLKRLWAIQVALVPVTGSLHLKGPPHRLLNFRSWGMGCNVHSYTGAFEKWCAAIPNAYHSLQNVHRLT